MNKTKFKLRTNQENTKNKKVLVIAVVILIVLAALATAYFVRTNQSETKRNDEAQIQTAKDLPSNDDLEPTTTQNKSTDQVDNRAKNEVPTSNELKLTVNSFTQSRGEVRVELSVTGVSGSGKCVVSFASEGARPVVRETPIQASNCVFNIPEVEFSKLGSWKMAATYYEGSVKSEVSQDVTIN